MILRLRTWKQIDRAMEFLRSEQRRRLRLLWIIGVVAEQRGKLLAIASTRKPRARVLNRESDMRFVMTDSQTAEISISAVDKRGNPATVENVVFASSDDTILEVVQDPADPMKATIRAVGGIGSAQVNVTADGRMGDEESPIAGTLDVDVVAGDAVGFTISPGTPSEQAE